MAAAALFRLPTGDPRRANDGVVATVGGMNLPQTNVASDSYAANAGSSVAQAVVLDWMGNIVGTTTFTMTATTTIQFVDLNDPSPPANPVGNYVISVNTTNQDAWTTAGSIAGIFNNVGANTNGTHTYMLADDLTGTRSNPNTVIVENWRVTYLAPVEAVIPVVAATVTAGPDALAVTGVGGAGIAGVRINGVTYNNSAGTVAGLNGPNGIGAGQITYTVSATAVTVMIVKPVGTLPAATTNPVPGLVPWAVNVTSNLGVAAVSNPLQASDMTTLTTHFDAQFQN